MDVLFDKLMAPMMVSLLLLMWAAQEWMRFYLPGPPRPWITTFMAALSIAYSLWQLRKHWPKIKALRLAEDGEKAVGQFLDTLRASGYQVFHDVVGEGFNVDHVVIGPAGIYTIETKTWKKPQRGSPEIQFDGKLLTAAGRTPDRDPVIQAKAQAGWMKQLLQASTGKIYSVRPVIVFPGWYVKASREARRDLWVLEPKALPSFLAQENAQIPAEDLKLAAFHLSRFIRSQEREFEQAK